MNKKKTYKDYVLAYLKAKKDLELIQKKKRKYLDETR
jgi:hypothetical protein